MADRKDRLAGMVAPGAKHDAAAPPPPLPAAATRQQALLYVPPPSAAGPWTSLLQNEGVDVLIATTPEAAGALLAGSRPSLVIAVVPVLGAALRQLFVEKAPQAELRVVSGLVPLLRDAVVSPKDALELALRGLCVTSALLAESRGIPRERAPRMALWTEKACASLGMSSSDRMAARLAAALYDVPRALSPAVSDTAPTLTDVRPHWKILASFLESIASPFPLDPEPPKGDVKTRAPQPTEVVQAAADYAVLLEARAGMPELELRKRAAAGELHPAAVEAVIAAAEARSSGRRGRILVVDGDAAARALLALRLANEGYAVSTAADGRGALQMIRDDPPALVLSETVLAGLDGYALLDAVKRDGRAIPFVFVSERTDALSINKGLLLGAVDFLGKPVNVEVLLTKLQKVLGQAISLADASARLSLADMSRAGDDSYPPVAYEDLAVGVTLLGRFRILADLGEGGMGKVFKARDDRLEEDVVIKVMKGSLTGDARVLEHFKREIRLARKVAHPAVVRLYDFFEAGAVNFVTMEFLEGSDLRNELKRRGAFPVPVSLRLAREMFEGLGAAHELGVIHRDIKPHNMFLLSGGHLKILDFGIAQGLDPLTGQSGTVTGGPIGTPEYMSPEQVMSEKLDARTDLYSAGVVLFELLTGRVPFWASDRVSTATMRLNSDPPAPSGFAAQITPELDRFVLRLLSRDRNRRPASAREALAELRGVSA
jgi:DNA-binding response OmpR family regulator